MIKLNRKQMEEKLKLVIEYLKVPEEKDDKVVYERVQETRNS